MTEIAESDTSERSKVESWRLHVLIEAGYPLHLAVEMITSGCAHATAAEILL